MELKFAKKLNKIWEAWNLRGFVLFSLSLQIVLIFFAPMRKRMANKLMILLIWSAYLLADWAANFAFGLISNSQFNSSSVSGEDNTDLLAFWAPFLLVHLGGPDTITAFALEDNELWRRHLLGLVFQILSAAYVFIQTIPNNRLWVLTVLVFLSGIVKYAERTRALYLASLDSMRNSVLSDPDPGPNYAKLMEEFSSMQEANIPTRIEFTPEPDVESSSTNFGYKKGKLDDLEVVQKAYKFFEIFKGLVVDQIFSFRERNESRDFFQNRSAEDAFKVIEVELNFIYEILYTKAVVINSKTGYFFRALIVTFMLTSFSLFYRLDKKGFNRFDVKTTYWLLLGSIFLETVALVMLIFSDWTAAGLKDTERNSIFATIFNKFLRLKRSWPSVHPTNFHTKCFVWTAEVLFRRWSGDISVINLMDYCLNERSPFVDTVVDYTGLKDFLDNIEYVSFVPFTEKLRDFIFEELITKSIVASDPETAKTIYSARGEWILKHNEWNCTNLSPYIDGVEYSESLLLWHIATELCYNNEGNLTDDEQDYYDFSKVLSDYMLYLLVMQPTMMAALSGIGQLRFRDTCAEAKQFLLRGEGKARGNHMQACEDLLAVNTEVKPVAVKGDRSKSVLFDACILAKELQKMEKKWKIMSKVWVELMSYAASHCRANAQVQQLSTGGELITFVWLLMAHFGLGGQFQINEGHARAKLIVDK